MPNFEQIIIAKTAWSNDYQGSPIFGRHEHVQKHRDGSDRFNFLPGPDGRFYVYLPPTSGRHIIPDPVDGWTILIVAAETQDNGRNFGPLKVVGWLENATFVENQPRPEYNENSNFDRSREDAEYTYNVVAESAFLVPVDQRDEGLPVKHGRKLGSASKVTVRSSTLESDDEWRRDYATFVEKFIKEHSKDVPPAEEVAENSVTTSYATQEHKIRVEKAAERLAKNYFKMTHRIQDVTRENRGYDFHLTHKTDRTEILLEVKGTASSRRGFFLSRNEFGKMNQDNRFLIFLASEVLSETPDIKLLKKKDLKGKFIVEPMSYRVFERDDFDE